MAEAMINEKYMLATMPTLPVDSPVSCVPSRHSDKQTQRHNEHFAFDEATDSRNPTNTSYEQRKRPSKVNFDLPPAKRSRRNTVNDVISGK